MWLKNCGWIKYKMEAPLPDGLRTWTFAKSQDGFRLYAEDQLLVDYTYETGWFNVSLVSTIVLVCRIETKTKMEKSKRMDHS